MRDRASNSNARACVSKDEGRAAVPSCFETPRRVDDLAHAVVLLRCATPQHEVKRDGGSGRAKD
jgi:hypothetical protein